MNHLKPVGEPGQRTLSVLSDEEKNLQNNSEKNSVHNKIIEILSKICFVCTATLFGKELSAQK